MENFMSFAWVVIDEIEECNYGSWQLLIDSVSGNVMKDFMYGLMLLGTTLGFSGCGGASLSCDELYKMGQETLDVSKKFGTAVDNKDKKEAKKNRDIAAKNCDEWAKISPTKCVNKGQVWEYGSKAEKEACVKLITAMDEGITSIK